MKRSSTGVIVYGLCVLLVMTGLSCGNSVNDEGKSANKPPPTSAPTNSMVSPKPTIANTQAIPEPSAAATTPESIKQRLDRITKLLNTTETQVKQEAMSPREREEDKRIRAIVGPPVRELRMASDACAYGASSSDNQELKIMISCSGRLEVRQMAANMRDLDADKIRDTGKSIIIPCKAKSGKCFNESVLLAAKGTTEYRKSSMLTINLNFTGNNIPTKLAALFSGVIRSAQSK